MKLPYDSHSHFQRLISARLDGFLEAAEEQELSEHLAECPTCRATSRDYRTQRGLMAALPARPAPRDLWARTAAALDRELAKAPHASGRGSRHGGPTATRSAPGSRWLGLTAVTSVLLAGAVVATQLQSTVAPLTDLSTQGTPGAQGAQPTPFDVTPQDMSVFDFTANGVAVYQTRVTEACPPPSIDCTSVQLSNNPVIEISGMSASNRGLAVNSRSGQLALVTGADSGTETVSVVRLPQYQTPDATDAATQRPTPVGTGLATAGQQPASSGPAATSEPTPAGTTSPTATPKPTVDGSETPPPTHTGPGSSPSATPAPTTPKPVRTHRPTPLSSGPASSSAPAGSNDPGASPTPATLPPDSSSGPVASGDGTTPQPAEAAMAIAEGVRLVGAAPAWSNAGDMLAFSATPADLSTGPDVYLWRVGQNKAVRLTHDHRSYFASWAADRIVISRIPAGATAGTGPVDASTVVRDLVSGEERLATGPQLWLPTVEPSARYAVAWVGRLRSDGHTVTPRVGGLYLVDWTAIDPFADHSARAATTPPAGGGSTATPPDATPDAATPLAGGATPAPTRTPRSHRPRPSAGQPTGAPPTTTPVPAATNPAATDPTGSATSPVLQAVDPQRDETADPVLDWVVRWSADGSTVGIWVADTPGSNWGRLAVVRVSLQAGQFNRRPVLGPNLARRAFSLGVDRVAWVAPSDGTADGELRIRTWDARGYGDLRIHNVDAGDGVPSF